MERLPRPPLPQVEALTRLSQTLAAFGLALNFESSALAAENGWETSDEAITAALAVNLDDQENMNRERLENQKQYAERRATIIETSKDNWEREQQDEFVISLEKLKQLRIKVRPEYEQVAEHILIGNGMTKTGDFLDMTEARFQEYSDIIAALPADTQVYFFSALQSQLFRSWAGQDQSNIASRVSPDNNGLYLVNPGLSRWAQDIGEIVTGDDKSYILASEFQLPVETPGIEVIQVPFLMDGGDVTPTGRHVLVGTNVLDFMRSEYSAHGLSVELPQLQSDLETIYDQPVLLIDSPFGFLPNMFHVDQFILPVSDSTVVSIDYDFQDSDITKIEQMVRETVEEIRQLDSASDITNYTPDQYNHMYNRLLYNRIILARESASLLNYAHDTLSQNGYTVIEIPVGVDRVLDTQSYINGTMYRSNDQTHFLMPTFGDEAEAQRVQGQLEQAGLIVHPVADSFYEDYGNIHCVTNVW